jgi:hypothetical protein
LSVRFPNRNVARSRIEALRRVPGGSPYFVAGGGDDEPEAGGGVDPGGGAADPAGGGDFASAGPGAGAVLGPTGVRAPFPREPWMPWGSSFLGAAWGEEDLSAPVTARSKGTPAGFSKSFGLRFELKMTLV